MSKHLKLGFIGGGINSAVGNTHRIASQMDNRFVLETGCFSKSLEINLSTAKEYGVKVDRTYKSWLELLKQEKDKIDALCVLTPTNYHTDIVIKALEMGYAVICEKALTSLVNDAEKIGRTVKSMSGFLAMTYNYTGYPMLRELREMVIRGHLGKINHIQAEMPQEGFARLQKDDAKPTPQAWRLKDNTIPTISLDLGVHLHSVIRFLTEEKPREVVSVQTTHGFFRQVIDNVSCIIRYTNDLTVQLWFSKSALGHRNGLRIRVYGEKASAEWHQMEPEYLIVCDQYGNVNKMDRASKVLVADLPRYNRFKSGHPAGFIEAFANYYFDIADSLEHYLGKKPYKSPYVFEYDAAKEGLLMLEAISLSAQKNIWCSVRSGENSC